MIVKPTAEGLAVAWSYRFLMDAVEKAGTTQILESDSAHLRGTLSFERQLLDTGPEPLQNVRLRGDTTDAA